MADRKQTPDILTEIMGATSLTADQDPQQVIPSPTRKPTRSTKKISKSPASMRENKTTLYEYRVVSFQDHKGYRPRYVNGIEMKDWMGAPLLHEYLNQMAEQGWDLAAASSGQHLYGLSDNCQLYFRRLR